ncbi:hypothetical protein GO986_04590 [Deinococcus sp. HMF7620]|uniref:Uncharacterized protein n=1 Tax=Deinococcus arboris TaxID=2682977 RepID=A0A7C9LKS7_9DEIO|nr:hypothetical protein [Deinococcus arboris]MVN86037.1 hypothetical protein [Deinococcus arboris]
MQLRPLFAAALALTLGGAQALTFGGLSITPRGEQRLNLETGATDLPQGGAATDARSGLNLTAERLNLLPGQTLNAQRATVTTKQGGTLKAPQLTYDLKAGTVTASGGVTYSDARLRGLSAPTLTLNVKTGFVTASGGVKAQTPALSGAALVFDPSTMQAVLTGPYRVNQGTLKADAPAGGRLLLVFGGNRVVRATEQPDADSLARFTPYLK